MGLALNSNFSGISYGASASMKTYQGVMGRSLKKISTGKNYAGGGAGASLITESVKHNKAAAGYEASYYTTQKSASEQAITVADLESRLEAEMAKDASIISSISVTTQANTTATTETTSSGMATALATAYKTLNKYDYEASYYQNLAGASQTAYSGVTDTDIAMEMSKYVKANVNAQAAQAMVAQANQSMASILNLLQ